MGLNTLSQVPNSITLVLCLFMPQAPAVLETSCFVFPLSLHFDVIRVALRTQKTVQEQKYKEELEIATTAKIPFNPYIMASHAAGNPVSTLRISYILDILSWTFFFLVYCQEASTDHANTKILQKVTTSPNLRVWKWGTLPTFTCKSGQECSALLSLPQSSTAMLITGAWQHQLPELPPATPSAGLHRLKDQEAEGPGRLICMWVRGLAKVGNGWESAALLVL